MGRFIPGLGAALELAAVAALLSPGNTDPAAAASKDKWTSTMGGTPAIGDKAKILIDAALYQYTIAGVTPEVYEGQITGTIGSGDMVHTVVKNAGVDSTYDYECAPSTTKIVLAAAIASMITVGSTDKWSFTVAGGNATGAETLIITIPGDTGGNTGTGVWTYSPPAGRTNSLMAGDLRTLLGTTYPSSKYTVAGGGTALSLLAITPGTTNAVTSTDSLAITLSRTHKVTGVAGQAGWTGASDGVDKVTFTHATNGLLSAASDSVSGSVTLGAGSTAWAPSLKTAGTNTPQATVLASLASDIAATDPTYTASVSGSGVVVEARSAGPSASTVSSQFSPSTGTGTFTTVHTNTGSLAGIASNAGLSLAGSIATTGTAVCKLNAGTSYHLEIWYRDASNVWTKDATFGTKTISGNASHAFTIPIGAMRVYAYCSTYVGVGASATVILTTND
ncbi:hypothetical protein UFOVP777_19 [uncultured Caudovirales phage]|uniref:Uncharacterized protein n=1 Tax=uncultured Caudovirales phage TaxID=2100421 RepID=A0A6J5NXR1_9CAUD|nr:hypothetical protein UFOVP777_19 [uncultured Caudovirales phage]